MSDGNRVCLVEDDAIMGESLCLRFELEGIAHDWYHDGSSARDALRGRRYQALISDIRLPDLSGEQLFEELQRSGVTPPPTLFITGHGAIDQAVRLLKLGARDYITKPFDIDELLAKLLQLAPALAGPEAAADPALGVSGAMRAVEHRLRRVARFPATVLLTGESGVGKEHAARLLHRELDRGSTPFVAVNCAALQQGLLEAELFGHEKGAFTGAVRSREGLFEQAHGGLLFLDEIGEMSLEMQAKLLRALQEGVIRRVGGNRDIPVATRLVCATNRELQAMVRDGAFREDLYYRINGVHVAIPPLRSRPDDILWFANLFLSQFCAQQRIVRRLSPDAERALRAHDWPGNLRELRHTIERACIFCNDEVIDAHTLQDGPEEAPAEAVPCDDLRDYLERCECQHIRKALEAHDWRIAETADALGISRKCLWEKMRKHAISASGDGY